MLRRNRQKGFTLIELLIVVAIIGIIAAILIPNLIDALQKAKQKRTVADMRNTGTAVMSWLTDQIGAASAGAGPYNAASAGITARSYDQVFEYLNQAANSTFFYMNEIPQFDGWKNEYEFGVNDNLLSSNIFVICSPGRNDILDAACVSDYTTAQTGPFIATDYDHDIIFADGFLISYPGNVAP